MADRVSKETRSAIMASVKSKNTKPELALRSALHKLGYRFRLHRRDLPGSPDIVFPSQKKAIFVHGCFWHGHGCRWGKLPKTRLDYWGPKILANRNRDKTKNKLLRKQEWTVLTVWACQLRNPERTLNKIVHFLRS